MWTGRRSNSNMCAAQQTTTSDIRKMGYLKKLKTNKKKLFLLREESEAGPARLEYYDSEKKYKAGGPAKRWISLRTCFNINKKSDAKHKYAIALYTKEDCFSMVCETDVEQEEWLAVLLELQNDNVNEGDEPRPFFEHIWQVTVKPRGLGNGKNLTAGPYRLCLTNKTLSLVRLSQHDPDIIFQLASLRRCGHSDCFFFMEAGSSAVTGAGELWMQVEDTVIARNIHETILRNMAGDQAFRPRSRSSVSDRRSTKPISVPGNSRGASPGYDSSTLPVRSKTISGDHPSSPTAPSRLRPGKGSSSGRSSTTSSLGRGHSPVPTSPLGHTLSEAHRSRTDSMESRGSHGTVSSLSADELDLSPHDHHSSTASTRSVTPEGASIRDDPSYLSMTPLGSKDILVSPTSELAPQHDPYMEMTSGMGSSRDSYMDMSPGETTYLEMARTSFSSSPAVSTTSSGLDPEEHCYLDMAPIAHSLPTVQERITDAGYLDMSPGNTWLKGPIPRPDRVHSYLSDDQASTEDFPKRAYSVGSKPTSIKNRGDNASSYVDMTGKDGNLDKANPKSSSAPHLVDKEKGGHVTPDMSRSTKEMTGRATIYNKELLMEFDFLGREGENSPFRPRTSSAGREFRQRTSSIGQEMRRRAGSFGKEGVNRTSSIGRHDRPRTTTICQDSFRNRTSSFGSTDMRPRSSSHGSRSYYKGKVAEKTPSETDSRGSSRHSSQESLRRTLQKAAEEYTNKGGSQESYMDMLMRRTPSPSVPPNTTPSRANEKAATAKMNSLWQEDEYLAMTPGGSVEGASGASAGASYMDMNYETPERHKDQRRRPNTDTPTKSTDSKAAKSSRPRSSMKSQHHRGLYLRMPSAEAKQADTKEDAKVDRAAAKSPGEYIDISFSAKPSAKPKSIALGKQKSYDSDDSKAVWSPQTDAYAVYAPGSVVVPSVGAGLDPVVCPLRLDEEDDTPNASPNAIQPGTRVSLPNTPKASTSILSDDYMLMPGQKDNYMEMPGQNPAQDELTPDTVTPSAVMTADPFFLLGPMSLESIVKQDSNKRDHPAPSRSLSTDSGTSTGPVSKPTDQAVSSGRNRLGSKGSSRNSSNRKSPVLPPKVRSKAKTSSTSSMNKEVVNPTKVVQTLSIVSTTVSTSAAASGVKLTRSLSTGHEGSGGKHGPSHVRVENKSTESVTLDPPFAELVPPIPIGVQKSDEQETLATKETETRSIQPSKLSASTNSLNSIEGGLSSSITKTQITSRGSTSSLSSMDSTRVITTMSGGGRLGQGVLSTRSEHLAPNMVGTSVMASGGCDYENLAVGGRASHHSSRNSIGSEKELNYASLDLASSQDETTFPAIAERSPRSPLIGKTTQQSPVNEEEEIDSTPLSYAEIDFTKSEELRAATSLRERMPFDVK